MQQAPFPSSPFPMQAAPVASRCLPLAPCGLGTRVLSNFCKVAATLLPYSELPSLAPLLYTGSGGGTGNLRRWLVRAMQGAISEDAPFVTWAHLPANPNAMTDQTVDQIFDAAKVGEERFAKLHSNLERKTAIMFTSVSLPPSSMSAKKSRSGQRHPGQRNAVRDHVPA